MFGLYIGHHQVVYFLIIKQSIQYTMFLNVKEYNIHNKAKNFEMMYGKETWRLKPNFYDSVHLHTKANCY